MGSSHMVDVLVLVVEVRVFVADVQADLVGYELGGAAKRLQNHFVGLL